MRDTVVFSDSRGVCSRREFWGVTPEGEACGLVKNLALMTHVTTDENDVPIASMCYSLGVENLELLSGEELHTPSSYLIMLNGLILGKHRRPKHFATSMRKLRRAGKLGEFVSIFVNEKHSNDSWEDDRASGGVGGKLEFLVVDSTTAVLLVNLVVMLIKLTL